MRGSVPTPPVVTDQAAYMRGMMVTVTVSE